VSRFVLLGHPVGHSISPAMQSAAFDKMGLDWTYEAIDVAPGELLGAVDRLRNGVWRGANVTIPHKQAVIPLLDDLSQSALHTSTVNTIVRDDNRVVGHNTDLPAFMKDLGSYFDLGLRPDVDLGANKNNRAAGLDAPATGTGLILGAGGAARSVAFGLAQQGLNLKLIARTMRPAQALAIDVLRNYSVEVELLPWEGDSFTDAGRDCSLVVNATPVGMLPHEQDTPWPSEIALPEKAFVYDLVYTPSETRLMRDARLAGLDAASGAGMLVEQGALSFELWTGIRAPRRTMRAALEAASENSNSISGTREVLNA
jgi:shikimate dehydrogenase